MARDALDDPGFWVGFYLFAGILWACYNSSSNFARRQMEQAVYHRMLLWHCIGFAIAVVLWPAGFLTTLWFKANRLKRKDGP
jgi:hypothetical protein